MSEQSKKQPNPQNNMLSEQNKATFPTAPPYQNNTSPNNFPADPYRTNEMPTQPMPQNNAMPQQGTMFNPYPNQPYNQAYPQQNNPQYPQYSQYPQNPQNQPDPRYQGSYPSYDPNQPPYQQPYQQYDPNYQQQYDPNQPPYQQPYEGQYQQPYQQYDPNQQPMRQGIDLNEIKVNFDPKTASALSYVLFFISGLYFFFTTEKENRFVRFHAMQSILFSAAWVVVFFVSNIIIISISSFFAVIGLSFMLKLVGVFSNLITLGLVATWIYSMYQAYQGHYWKLPIIGDMAEKQVDTVNL